MTSLAKLLVVLALVLMPFSVSALEFRSVAAPKAVLYDAPSTAAKKTWLLSQFYPVEVIVNLGDWLKVRDAQGTMNWVDAKQLSSKRMVLVKVNSAEIRLAPDPASKLLATIEKDLVLEVLEIMPGNGWLKVKNRDGVIGYILNSSIWGAE